MEGNTAKEERVIEREMRLLSEEIDDLETFNGKMLDRTAQLTATPPPSPSGEGGEKKETNIEQISVFASNLSAFRRRIRTQVRLIEHRLKEMQI